MDEYSKLLLKTGEDLLTAEEGGINQLTAMVWLFRES